MTVTEAPYVSGLCICVVLSAWGGVSRSSVTRVLDEGSLVGKRDENILIRTLGEEIVATIVSFPQPLSRAEYG